MRFRGSPPGVYLLVWVDVDVAFDALLPHVGPGVSAHPLPLTLGTLVLPEASLLSLVWRQSLPSGSGLRRRRSRAEASLDLETDIRVGPLNIKTYKSSLLNLKPNVLVEGHIHSFTEKKKKVGVNKLACYPWELKFDAVNRPQFLA